MKLIKPSYEILEQGPGLEGIYEAIERAGRTCYKSTRPEGQTAKNFVDRMVASKHYAMLEHGTVYLTIPYDKIMEYVDTQNPYDRDILCNPWVKYILDYANDVVYVSSNYRWIIENNLEDWLQYLCEPTEFHERRVSVKFGTDIGVTRELNRHRVDSVAEQSTRYCNYSKDKFGNEISVCLNEDIHKEDILQAYGRWTYPEEQGTVDWSAFNYMCSTIGVGKWSEFGIIDTWLFANLACQWSYMRLIELGWKPQQARRVLPLDLSTEIVHTTFVSDWKHCFDLRVDGTTGAPHPGMKALMSPVKNEFIKRGYIDAN